MLDLLSLFGVSFLSATLLPGGSEAFLLYLHSSSTLSPWFLWLAASLGNTLGGITNWILGRYFLRFEDRKWFPVSKNHLDRASFFFQKYGLWSLLFSWLPIIGDALCVFAGLSRIRLFTFFVLVLFGKSVRYAILLVGAAAIW